MLCQRLFKVVYGVKVRSSGPVLAVCGAVVVRMVLVVLVVFCVLVFSPSVLGRGSRGFCGSWGSLGFSQFASGLWAL